MGLLISVTNDQKCWKTKSSELVGLTIIWGSVPRSLSMTVTFLKTKGRRNTSKLSQYLVLLAELPCFSWSFSLLSAFARERQKIQRESTTTRTRTTRTEPTQKATTASTSTMWRKLLMTTSCTEMLAEQKFTIPMTIMRPDFVMMTVQDQTLNSTICFLF